MLNLSKYFFQNFGQSLVNHISIKNLFFYSVFLLIFNNLFLNLHSNSVKFNNIEEIKIKSIFSNKNSYFMSSVERSSVERSMNKQFESLYEIESKKHIYEANKKKFLLIQITIS